MKPESTSTDPSRGRLERRVRGYEILSLLGAGGMGDMYRAGDTRRQRDVALKILPEAFARDTERLSRFEREAHVLATLNHPGIAAIHGLEPADDGPVLVMELVEGEGLDERLAWRRLLVRQALELLRQMAAAKALAPRGDEAATSGSTDGSTTSTGVVVGDDRARHRQPALGTPVSGAAAAAEPARVSPWIHWGEGTR
jgi:serine/threonine protein kinase